MVVLGRVSAPFGVRGWVKMQFAAGLAMALANVETVEMGGPLGKTRRIDANGITEVSNALTGFTVVRAASQEEAARLFENHPHFAIFPGEAIEVMQALWREPRVTYEGRFYHLSDAYLAPKPVQPGGPPVWFGGFSDQILAATVRYGHGWINGTNPDPDFVLARWALLREFAAEAGRDPAEIRVCVPLMAHLGTDRERARASIEGYITRGDFETWLGSFFGENARRFGLWGAPEDALPRLKPYLDIGVRDFIFDLRPPGIARESAELLAAHVLPRLASM